MRYLWQSFKTWFIVKRKRFWRLSDGSMGDEFTRFAILCAPRSGSKLLHTYLNAHSAILSHDEILRRKIEKEEELLSIDEFAFSPQSKKIKAVGLKLFYEYGYRDRYKVAFHQVKEDASIKIVHLVREDKRQQLSSLRKAEQSDAWSSTLKQGEQVRTALTEEDLTSFEKEQVEMIASIREQFANHEILEVTYEDLLADPKPVLDKIQAFIQVESKPLFTLLQKQGKE